MAFELGEMLAREQIGLVYGGATIGLMGVVANAARNAGGEVIGVIPRSLVRPEVAHTDLDDLRIVETMHDRKALMASLSDAFIAMPGGIGTLEETFEIWSWAQIGEHTKPFGLLNVDGYFDGLLTFLQHVVDQGFLNASGRELLIVEDAPRALLTEIRQNPAA
jgi:uncharacterized protein (TIGR00730 family)